MILIHDATHFAKPDRGWKRPDKTITFGGLPFVPEHIPVGLRYPDHVLLQLPLSIAKCYMLWENLHLQTHRLIIKLAAKNERHQMFVAFKKLLETCKSSITIRGEEYLVPDRLIVHPGQISQDVTDLGIDRESPELAQLAKTTIDEMLDARGNFDHDYQIYIGEARLLECALRHLINWNVPQVIQGRLRSQIAVLKQIRGNYNSPVDDISLASFHGDEPLLTISSSVEPRPSELEELVEHFTKQEKWEVDNKTGYQRNIEWELDDDFITSVVGDIFLVLPYPFKQVMTHLREITVENDRVRMEEEAKLSTAVDISPGRSARPSGIHE